MKLNNRKELILLAGILVGAGCIYFLIFYLFIANRVSSDDKTLFDSVTALISLFIGTITIFFIYKTYYKQKVHLEIQEREIRNNRKDVEFNRGIDIFYRQLENSKKFWLYKEIDLQLGFRFLKQSEWLFREKVFVLLKYAENLKQQFSVFEVIIEKQVSNEDDREFLMLLLYQNMPTHYADLITNVYDFSVNTFNNSSYKNSFEGSFKEKAIEEARKTPDFAHASEENILEYVTRDKMHVCSSQYKSLEDIVELLVPIHEKLSNYKVIKAS